MMLRQKLYLVFGLIGLVFPGLACQQNHTTPVSGATTTPNTIPRQHQLTVEPFTEDQVTDSTSVLPEVNIIWRNKNRQWHELQWSTLMINQRQTWQKHDTEGLLTTKLQVGLKYLRSVQGSKGLHRLPVFWFFGISAQEG
jgi:hypothetical protein